MLKKINYNDIYEAEHGFLNSRHHFSFAEYFDHKNMGFGDVRVVNDDLVKPFAGFPTHPHKNMEILSYVVKGYLTHKDSMGSDHTISQGEVQYMSAGTVLHIVSLMKQMKIHVFYKYGYYQMCKIRNQIMVLLN